MKRYFPIVVTILFLLGISACAQVTPAPQDIAPTPQPTTAGGFHPLTTRTGIEEIDNILDVVANGDIERLRSLIQFTNTKCTQLEGLGGPPKCRAGEAEGTPVEVFPFLGPEGSFFRKDEIENWPGVEATDLYAVYQVSPAVIYEENYPAGKYAVMFVEKENQSVISLRVDNGRIVRVDYIFDLSPEVLNGWLQREASTVILAPVTR